MFVFYLQASVPRIPISLRGEPARLGWVREGIPPESKIVREAKPPLANKQVAYSSVRFADPYASFATSQAALACCLTTLGVIELFD